MDELDLRLRSRLRSLAEAVPVAEQRLVRLGRPSPATRRVRFAPVAAGVVVVVTAVATLAILGRGPAPVTTPATSTGPAVTAPVTTSAPPTPAGPSPSPSSPSPSPATGSRFRLQVLVQSECPQTEGGRCNYDATLAGPDGQPRHILLSDAPMPLAPGAYRLAFTSRFGSDVGSNGSPWPGPIAATCLADFSVPDAGPTILARVVVRSDNCVIALIGGQGTAAPTATRPPADVALPYPEGCPAYGLSPRRCAYIVDEALAEAAMTNRPAMVELLGDPDCVDQATDCHVRLGGGMFIVRVRITPADGQPIERSVFCGLGGETSLRCTDTPKIRVSSPLAGYHDVPCNGEGGVGTCASPVPTIDPGAVKGAVPLQVPSVIVTIDHTGEYVIDVGDAVLPNGILSETTAGLANDTRSDLLIPDGVRLEVVGEDGRQLQNAYEHGWRPGTERVHVRFTFTVESFDPGATLILTSVVVR